MEVCLYTCTHAASTPRAAPKDQADKGLLTHVHPRGIQPISL